MKRVFRGATYHITVKRGGTRGVVVDGKAYPRLDPSRRTPMVRIMWSRCGCSCALRILCKE